MGSHTSFSYFCVSVVFFFRWQGCGSFRKWDCSSAFYKTSEVIFPLWAILGRENGNGREENVFFQGSGTWLTALLLVVYRNVSITGHMNTTFMTKCFVEWKNQWLGKRSICPSSWTNTTAGISGTQVWCRDCWRCSFKRKPKKRCSNFPVSQNMQKT